MDWTFDQGPEGGARTALFSFDRNRERQIAEQYSRGNQDWLAARYKLIDEVLEYRRAAVLKQSLLDACEAEFSVASWANSEGIRRLVELACDGHSVAAVRLDELMSSKDWRVRYEALRTGFEHAKNLVLRQLIVRRGLSDRSARIRQRMASEAMFAHLIEMVDELEQAACVEAKDDNGKSIFTSAYYLRANEVTGEKGRFGGTEQDFIDLNAAWVQFKAQNQIK